MSSKLKKIIIFVLIIIVLFVVYTFTTKPTTQGDPLITGVNDSTQLLGAQISQALLRIEQITLDKGIFEDEIYKTLQDRSSTIEAESRGRSNPFAPLGSVSTSSIQTQTQTTTTAPPTTTTPPGAPSSEISDNQQ